MKPFKRYNDKTNKWKTLVKEFITITNNTCGDVWFSYEDDGRLLYYSLKPDSFNYKTPYPYKGYSTLESVAKDDLMNGCTIITDKKEIKNYLYMLELIS